MKNLDEYSKTTIRIARERALKIGRSRPTNLYCILPARHLGVCHFLDERDCSAVDNRANCGMRLHFDYFDQVDIDRWARGELTGEDPADLQWIHDLLDGKFDDWDPSLVGLKEVYKEALRKADR